MYTVTGIVFNAKQPSSIIIDGHVLHEGDAVYGATIVKITADSAELRQNGQQWTVRPGASYRGSTLVSPGN